MQRFARRKPNYFWLNALKSKRRHYARAYVEFTALIHGKAKEDPLAVFSLDTTHVSLYIFTQL